ncbi:MAG: hypothetical protein NZ775_09365 [Gammaproteobacteria bacterium]|nr:hypothetical protein [Gammaproteobacteria bacterium]
MPWIKTEIAKGVAVKTLCSVNDQTVALYRFALNTLYLGYLHERPGFVYLLEGGCRQNSKWIEAGCSSAAETGAVGSGFINGENGRTFLAVYSASKYS